MKYTVFVSIPTKVEVEALNEEDAKNKVYDNLVATKQIKPADGGNKTKCEHYVK